MLEVKAQALVLTESYAASCRQKAAIVFGGGGGVAFVVGDYDGC